jgi:hypothetical protein
MFSELRTNRQKLIVILPGDLAGNLEVANKVHWLAIREQCSVFYLTLLDDFENALTYSRKMATMSAVTEGNILEVQSKLVAASSWLGELRKILLPTDLIVCQAEQLARVGRIKAVPLAEFVRSELTARTLVMKGYYKPYTLQIKRWFIQLLYFLGFLAIFAVFTAGEIYLDRNLLGLARSLFMVTAIIGEFGTALIWNDFTNRWR